MKTAMMITSEMITVLISTFGFGLIGLVNFCNLVISVISVSDCINTYLESFAINVLYALTYLDLCFNESFNVDTPKG